MAPYVAIFILLWCTAQAGYPIVSAHQFSLHYPFTPPYTVHLKADTAYFKGNIVTGNHLTGTLKGHAIQADRYRIDLQQHGLDIWQPIQLDWRPYHITAEHVHMIW
jgi:hypothetical protein